MTRRLISILLTSLFLFASEARAQTAPANTGASGNVVAGLDTKWDVSTNGGLLWTPASQVNDPVLFGGSGGIPPNWEPNTGAYSWISASPTGTGGGGDYLFRTFFDLSGFDPGSALMSFLCTVDNLPSVGQYSLNGGAYAGTCGHQDLYHFTTTQTVNSGFNGGVNELRFHVTGDSRTDGLLVGNMALQASIVPEPASMVLLGTGLVGVFGVAARRRRGA